MKKTLALILSILALLIPVSALELDVAEADVAVEETAVLAASGATPTVPVYDATYGELIYFEDFSDNSWGNAYTTGTEAFAFANQGGSNADPANGYGYIESTTLSMEMYNLGITDIKTLTVKTDILKSADSTVTYIPVWGPTGLNDWGTFKVSSANTETWTTQVCTFSPSGLALNATGATNVHIRAKYCYIDNLSLYVTYDLGSKIRLVENNAISYADLTDLETYTFAAPENAGYNVWMCYDNKTLYTPGVAYNASDLAGKSFKPAYMPELEHETYGDLIYFSDAGDDYARNYVNKTVAGDSATASYELGYDAEKAWSHNVVDDPANSGRGKVEKLTTGTQYKYYNGIYPQLKNFNIKDSDITVVWDIYVDAATAASVTDPRFYFQTASGFNKVTSASYDMTAGGWQTIVMPYTANPLTFDSTKQSINTMFGFAETGKTYYVDNFRVYAKKLDYAEKPASVDETLGNLIYFDNGNTDDAVSSDKISVYGVGSAASVEGYVAKQLYRNTDIGMVSPGLIVKSTNGTFAENGLNGTITVVTDAYSSENYSYFQVADIKYTDSYWAWGSWFAGPGKSSSAAFNPLNVSVNTSASVSALGFMKSSDSGTPYARSIAVYLKPYTVTIGGEVIDLGAYKEYTLPTGEGFNYYKGTDGSYFEAGKSFASSVLDGKTLTAVKIDYATKPADFSHGRGILVYFDNGNEADFYSNINANLVGFAKTTDVDGYFTRDLSGNASAGITGTKGVGLDTGDTETKLAYADGTDMNGAIYLVVDMYNNSDSNNVFYRAVRTNSWDLWQGIYTDWRKYTANSKQWTNIAEAFNSELSFIGFADTDNANWQDSTFRSVYAYYMPNTRVALDVSGTPEIIDLTGKTEYTFPEITDGVNNVWRDSKGVYYFPGDVAAVEDINTNTYFAANFNAYAPETETGVEMRLTSDTANNGIRFKAAIAPSKKAEADEAGFIVARKDVLETLNAELTFDLTAEGVENAEGKLFVKGVTYNKADGTDMVSDVNDNGEEVFAAVCTGIDVTSKAQVNTVLVARPYLKMSVGEKVVTVYGTANSASLAQAATDLKTAADAGDSAALEAYNGAKDYIDGVISVGAGN